MLLFQFFTGDHQEIPDTLIERSGSLTLVLIGFLTISFLLVAFSRMSNNRAIQTIIGVVFKTQSAEQHLKENMRLDSLSSVLLFINYIIGFSLCVFVFGIRIAHFHLFFSVILAAAMPIMLILQEIIGLYIVGWVTGEQKKIGPAVLNTITVNQFSGLLFSLLALFWIMNPYFDHNALILFIAIICLKYMLRLFKSSFSVLTNGVPWYYLILYFCSLEILPLLVVYYAVFKNFLK